MSAYLQLGHDSENLISATGPEGFTGIVLSPVNRSEAELAEKIPEFRKNGQYDIVLDPQLYCPLSERGKLTAHSYFPKDLDTADLSSDRWWRQQIGRLGAEALHLDVDAVCSPAALPQKWTPDYYTRCADTYSMLAEKLSGSRVRSIMTICVALKELTEPDDALRIASIVTSRGPKLSYIVIEADVAPRNEIADARNLFALMVLVSALEKSGCRTLVSHCSSDMILMKAAGASHCASGKFFNLRRFTRSRFDEQQDEGGRLLAYWFEHNLLAFLREVDIARLQRSGFGHFIGGGDSNNGFAKQILQQFVDEPGKAWVALSWRQYLTWFAATERRLSQSDALTAVANALREADNRWRQLEENDVLMEERRNDGQWVRNWRQALSDFRKFEL